MFIGLAFLMVFPINIDFSPKYGYNMGEKEGNEAYAGI